MRIGCSDSEMPSAAVSNMPGGGGETLHAPDRRFDDFGFGDGVGRPSGSVGNSSVVQGVSGDGGALEAGARRGGAGSPRRRLRASLLMSLSVPTFGRKPSPIPINHW
jgi:hypothetical protein